jgi:Predicted membrane protein (DUF2254)
MQRGLFASLLLLIAIGVGADVLVHHEWGRVTGFLGIQHWLRHHVAPPKPATLRNFLAVAAAGTATILGLVLSISLIVWQATADRYTSSTIVAFLLRERLGRAFVRLLALAFAYSLWVLALLELTRFPPYASAAIALCLTTAAVLSLISYRELGLLGYLPQSIGRRLAEDIVREVIRAHGKHAGRSVEKYSRRLVEADLQIFEDLLRRLADDNEVLDVAACLSQLGAVLSSYLQLKSRLNPDSGFFATRRERLGPAGYAITETISAEGLMTPTADVRDHVWLERRLLEVTKRTQTEALLANEGVALALIRLWTTALQYAWYREDPDALKLLLAAIEDAATDPNYRAAPSVAEEMTTVPWVMIELVGNELPVAAKEIVQREPWRDKARVRGLPWKAQEDARDLAEKIRLELAVTGHVVTPESEMVREISAARDSRLADARSRLLGRAMALARLQLRTSVEEGAKTAPVIAQMTLQAMLRVVHHGLELPDLANLAVELYGAADLADAAQIRELHEAAGRAARVLAQRDHWPETYELLRASETISYLARSRMGESTERIVLFYDALFTAALVHGWAEYHRVQGRVREVGRYLQQPYTDLDALSAAAASHQLLGLTTLAMGIGLPSVVHYQWAQPLLQAANELPEVPVAGGGLGYIMQRDHPSTLFSHAGLLSVGPGDCLEHLIEATLADRSRVRQELLAALEALIQERGEP